MDIRHNEAAKPHHQEHLEMFLLNEIFTIVLTVVLTTLAIVATVLRLWHRRNLKKINRAVTTTSTTARQLDDLFCLLALLVTIPTSCVIIWGAAKGSVGSHSSPSDAELWYTTVTPKWVTLAQVVWVVLFLQPLALGFIKLSVLFFYRRLFRGRSFNIISWVLVAIVACWMTAFFFGLFFDCGSKIDANWGSLSEIAAQCPFGFLPTIIYTILDAVFDLFILLLPIPWIFRLQMSLKLKLSVLTCLMLGGIATAAAFVRMAIFIESGIPSAALNKEYIMGLPTYDVVGIVSAEMVWTMIETTVALAAICLPTIQRMLTMKNLFRTFGLEKYYLSRSSTSTRQKAPTDNVQEVKGDMEVGGQVVVVETV